MTKIRISHRTHRAISRPQTFESSAALNFKNLAFSLAFAAGWAFLPTQTAVAETNTRPVAEASSGQKDFDWELGSWKTNVRVLRNPLSGQPAIWAEYEGTSLVRPLLGGKANFVELAVSGPFGKIEGGSLRLYNPQSRQWSLNFASLRDGMLTAPVYGGFDQSGNGSFIGQDTLDGRAILVRFLISRRSPNEARFEQAFSGDGGKSWEVNWIAIDTLQSKIQQD